MYSNSSELKKIKDCLDGLSSLLKDRLDLERIHRDNEFNRRMSVVLSSFSDIETILLRLEKNILKCETIERGIQKRNNDEDKEIIQEEGQILRREEEIINRENKVDLKALYIFTKIFLDDFTQLIRFIYNWRNIGDRSITQFYSSLKIYTGTDHQILLFKKECFEKIELINNFVTQYRDNGIIHNQSKHKQTTWFINDMRGGVKQVGVKKTGDKQSSVTPIELITMVREFLCLTTKFINHNI